MFHSHDPFDAFQFIRHEYSTATHSQKNHVSGLGFCPVNILLQELAYTTEGVANNFPGKMFDEAPVANIDKPGGHCDISGCECLTSKNQAFLSQPEPDAARPDLIALRADETSTAETY